MLDLGTIKMRYNYRKMINELNIQVVQEYAYA